MPPAPAPLFRAFVLATALAACLMRPAMAQDAVDLPALGDLRGADGEPSPGLADGLGLDGPASAFAPADNPVAPGLGNDDLPFAPTTPNVNPADLGFPTQGDEAQLVLSAALLEGGGSLQGGVDWKVFASEPDETGRLELVASAIGGVARFTLPPGVYFVHCQYGYAMNTVRVDIGAGLSTQDIVLNAGGLKLTAGVGDQRLLGPGEVNFDIFAMDYDQQGERRVIARDVPPDTVVPLASGTYHVVSEYGTINAVIRADLEVEAGKLTEVTLFQRAAEVTLKLVREAGGEAIADTSWSVLTPGGDTVTDGVGAFPSFVLAAGDYTVVARHGESIYSRDFVVVAGDDDDVEVVTSETMEPGTPMGGEGSLD
jgi:hypothetical protein